MKIDLNQNWFHFAEMDTVQTVSLFLAKACENMEHVVLKLKKVDKHIGKAKKKVGQIEM